MKIEQSQRLVLPRSTWHRRTAALPLAYFGAIVVLSFVHQLLPQWEWTGIHLLLLGAVTNAILVWSAHFTEAVLRAQPQRTSQAWRLAVLNAGVLGVLTGGLADLRWVGVAGAGAVLAAVVAHLAWLVGSLRAALPARFAVTVHYYVAAAIALLTGIPVGAWMLVVDDSARSRLLLFHAHVNLLGWVTLTVLGTLLTLWPTVLRTRVAEGADTAARRALPVAVTGLVLVALGVLVWWPVVAAGGVAVFGAAALITFRPALRAARRKTPASFTTWSMAAAGGWLLVALGLDAASLLTAAGPDVAAGRFDAILVPLLVGFVAQTLIGALSYLMPVALGGGPEPVRRRTALLDRHWAQRVTMANTALVVFLLPVGPYVRITTSLLVLAALVQFLVPAVRVLVTARR